MLNIDDLAYGTGKHRHAPVHRRETHDDMDEIADLGRTVVKGAVVVGTVAIGAHLVAGALGSFP